MRGQVTALSFLVGTSRCGARSGAYHSDPRSVHIPMQGFLLKCRGSAHSRSFCSLRSFGAQKYRRKTTTPIFSSQSPVLCAQGSVLCVKSPVLCIQALFCVPGALLSVTRALLCAPRALFCAALVTCVRSLTWPGAVTVAQGSSWSTASTGSNFEAEPLNLGMDYTYLLIVYCSRPGPCWTKRAAPFGANMGYVYIYIYMYIYRELIRHNPELPKIV